MSAFLTPEQYLEIERKAEYKSEYFGGQMVAMAGASREHCLLSGNLWAILYPQLRTPSCEIYGSKMRLKVTRTGLYTYPDVVVVCGPPRFTDDVVDTLINPTFLAEVLSPSTEAYDRGRKFEHYRSLESLSEYLLVAQDRMHADLYTRQPDGSWVLREASQADDTLELRSIACHISMADLYSRLNLLSSPNAQS
jgi:Uma2 family endonuclease